MNHSLWCSAGLQKNVTLARDFARHPCATALSYALGWLSVLLLAIHVSGFTASRPTVTAGVAPSFKVQQTLPIVTTPIVTTTTWPLTSTTPSSLNLPIILTPLALYLPLVTLAEPPAVLNPYPADGLTDQSANVFLSWLPQPAMPPPVYYDLYLEANNPNPTTLIVQGLTQAAYDPLTFTPDTQYYWRIMSYDAQGIRREGPVWTFHVEPQHNPPLIDAMMLVPAGEFQMGCDRKVEGCKLDTWHQETPLHRVYLDAYEIDKYEVTNRQYRSCVTAGACSRPRLLNSRTHSDYFNNPTWDYYPVIYVSWWNAKSYCQWAGKRLPTEAEWEKAARGPIDTRPWIWGSERTSCARGNHDFGCAGGDTAAAGSFPAGTSPYGVWDMDGNVFEWVADLYDVYYYESSPYANPQGPNVSHHNHTYEPDPPDFPYFTLRGGSFHDRAAYARTAHRHFGHHGDKVGGDAPYYRNNRTGFRCARSVEPGQ